MYVCMWFSPGGGGQVWAPMDSGGMNSYVTIVLCLPISHPTVQMITVASHLLFGLLQLMLRVMPFLLHFELHNRFLRRIRCIAYAMCPDFDPQNAGWSSTETSPGRGNIRKIGGGRFKLPKGSNFTHKTTGCVIFSISGVHFEMTSRTKTTRNPFDHFLEL